MLNLGKLIYDSTKNERIPAEYAKYSQSERENAIREKIFEVLGVTEYEKKSFRKAMRRHSVEVYEIIEEVIDNVLANGDYLKDAFFLQFVESKNLALGDENRFYVEGDKELEVAEFSGSHYDLKRQRFDVGTSFSVTMKDYGIKVFEYFERIASGRVDFATVVNEIAKAIDKKLVTVAEETFIKAVEAIPSEFKYAGGTDIEAILEVVEHVQCANGQDAILVGTKTALRKLNGLVDVAMYSDGMKDEKNKVGVIPFFEGVPCMELKQGHKVGTFDFVMKNDEIYVFAGDQKPVKVVLEGETEVKEISDGQTNADGSVEHTVRYKMGCSIAYGGVIGKITLSA